VIVGVIVTRVGTPTTSLELAVFPNCKRAVSVVVTAAAAVYKEAKSAGQALAATPNPSRVVFPLKVVAKAVQAVGFTVPAGTVPVPPDCIKPMEAAPVARRGVATNTIGVTLDGVAAIISELTIHPAPLKVIKVPLSESAVDTVTIEELLETEEDEKVGT